MTECLAFLDTWTCDPAEVKPAFERFKSFLESCENAELSFKSRPGVSYSLRGKCPGHERDLFVMVDVVDDDPEDRWLSVCFYDDQVSDPDEIGDWVPEGLAGKDARCFDVSSAEEELVAYVQTRIGEAWNASRAAVA